MMHDAAVKAERHRPRAPPTAHGVSLSGSRNGRANPEVGGDLGDIQKIANHLSEMRLIPITSQHTISPLSTLSAFRMTATSINSCIKAPWIGVK